MRSILFLAAICCLNLVLAACSKGKSGELTSESVITPIGKWQSPCISNAHASASGNLELRADGYTLTATTFSDADCQNPGAILRSEGAAVIEPPAPGTSIGNLNFVQSSLTLTAMEGGTASEFNAAAKCGKSDWQSGTVVDVNGKDCGTGQINPANGTQHFDIYRSISGSDGKPEIRFGEFGETITGATADTRPTTLAPLQFGVFDAESR